MVKVPFWVRVVQYSFRDCQYKGELAINTEEDDFMTARFSGTILHAVTALKKLCQEQVMHHSKFTESSKDVAIKI